MKKLIKFLFYASLLAQTSLALAKNASPLTLERRGGSRISTRLLLMDDALNAPLANDVAADNAANIDLSQGSNFRLNHVFIDVGLIFDFGLNDFVDIEVSPFFGATFVRVGSPTE